MPDIPAWRILAARVRRPSLTGRITLAIAVGALAATYLASTGALAAEGQARHSGTSPQDTSLNGVGSSAGPLRTVTVSTQKQLVAAVAAASPGTTISLNRGTYDGGLLIRTSGTRLHPIVMKPAGNGPVTLTAHLPMPSCNASSPDPNRTVRLTNGASYWTLRGLTVNGGIYISGDNVLKAHLWFASRIDSGNWQARRAVPGRGTDSPAAGRNAIPYLARQTGARLRPADGIRIVHDVITRKGIQVSMGRYGTIQNTRITNIACGTGPGIWFGTYSDGWTISGNAVSRVANSTRAHYMQEGIRIDGASDYNLIEHNVVFNLPGDGRAITTDQDASYNTITHNRARQVSVGFNDEMSGWGNSWTYNTVTGYRAVGFAFRMMDNRLRQPSMDTSTISATVRCNSASGTGDDLQMGASRQSHFTSNAFRTIALGKYLRLYWNGQGNTWNGSHRPPSPRGPGNLKGC
ncbi:MAG: hypothetical protein QOI51_500 [Nocardioidaceae bacterium]|nr:hypothetical protein [Nocardioidaceae bacterium]